MLKDKILSLLKDKPRTVKELAQLTGYSPHFIEWCIPSLPVEYDGNLVYLVNNPCNPRQTQTILTDSPASKSKSKHSNHRLSYKQSNQRPRKKKRDNNTTNQGLQLEVYNSDHGWLTKPLTIPDFSILSSITPRQRRILQLLHQGKTQSQIARILKITRQAVYKHVKKFLKWDLIREKGSLHGDGKRRDIVYEVRHAVVSFLKLNCNMGCKPQNMGGDSSPQKPLFTLHRLQLAFHIVNQSKPFTTNTPSFVKTYSPRGWTGYVYQVGNVRIRALPRKVIAEFIEEQKPSEGENAEQLLIRCIDSLKHAVELWLEELEYKGVELELSHPYIMNAPEFAFKSRLIREHLKNLRLKRVQQQLMHNGGLYEPVNESICSDTLSDLWVDDSPSEEGEDYAHLETSSPDEADLVDQALRNALDLPRFISPIQEEIQKVKALIESGIPIQQQMYQLMGIIGHLLKEIASLRQELASLKAAGGDSG